jgi:DNA-binding NarL/FixJ family response regulator
MISARPRIAIADDEVLVRDGLASLLRHAGYEVVAESGDATHLLDAVTRLRPDLVITDIRMPPAHDIEGLDAARAIRARFPRIAILVLSAHAEVEHATDILAGGDRTGYLLKASVTDAEEFLTSINRLLNGGTVIDPALVRELIQAQRADDPVAHLSAREREVLRLLAQGRSNAAIGHALWIAEGTVEKHVRSIFSKLRIPESPDDHRRVIAALRFLDRRLQSAITG